MATGDTLGLNRTFPIYYDDDGTKTPFHDLVLKKATFDSVVMSLGDKITGDVYYKDNTLAVTMREYIEFKWNPDDEEEVPTRFVLVNPPTIVREGMASDNVQLKGMTKYSFTFYHPMYMLGNFPFTDVAVTDSQKYYLSENKTFQWVGNFVDLATKLNKNLDNTEWYVTINVASGVSYDIYKLSDVMTFDNQTVAEVLKRAYETWEVPYIIDNANPWDNEYSEGKLYRIVFGLPNQEIFSNVGGQYVPFVFHFGKGLGLKNNSRTPRNNKIVTRIAGYGSEDNIPYGYPQIPWYGNPDWDYTINNSGEDPDSYPLYMGIMGGRYVKLIKHPFTRNHLMPSIYVETLFNRLSPYLASGATNPNYDPDTKLIDYYDAIDTQDETWDNPIVPSEPSYEIHEFGDIKPELGEIRLLDVTSYDNSMMDAISQVAFLDLLDGYYSESENEDEKDAIKALKESFLQNDSDEQWSNQTRTTYQYDWRFHSDGYFKYVTFKSTILNFEHTVLLNNSVIPTPDWDDSMDDDGNYVQSYFRMVLPALGFDLYACAAITQKMSIYMRSGACIGCTFPVAVDWEDYKRNFYNADGEFDPVIHNPNLEEDDGHVRDGDKYPDSTSTSISVVVKKENTTFGKLMPNIYQQPHGESLVGANDGDKFVILGISLPQSYVTGAEKRLDADMLQYMHDNNVYYYDYPLKFDEHFLAKNANILAQMRPNVIARFEYCGVVHALYIKQLTIKYGDKPLPEYNITLTDDIEIVLNPIGQVTSEVSSLRLLMGEGGVGAVNDNRYLRKDVDDTAQGLIRLIRGLQVGERYVTGLLGEGGIFRMDADGRTYLECDRMYVRVKAYFDTVEVRKYKHSGGNRVASPAGMNCSRVEYYTSNGVLTNDASEADFFRCFFRADDNGKKITNDFEVGDLACCEETNVDSTSLQQHYYARLVTNVSQSPINEEHYIDLSNRHDANGNPQNVTITVGQNSYTYLSFDTGSEPPIAQDDIVQMGNIWDTTRQGAIVEFVSGENAPSYQIFQGINTYNHNGNMYISLGYDSSTARAYMNVYGDMYVGAIPAQGETEGSTYIHYTQGDGTLLNPPRLKIKAILDIGSMVDDNGTEIPLSQFVENNRVFGTGLGNVDANGYPIPPYKKGDLWINANYTPPSGQTSPKYENEILVCERDSGVDAQGNPVFSIGDWQLASDYNAYRYLTDVLKAMTGGTTQIAGGLVLSSMVALRDTAATPNIWSGISGMYSASSRGYGVAAWYGGDPIDKESLIADYQRNPPAGTTLEQYLASYRYAKSLFRFDGSGYVADGNISWDASGELTVKGDTVKTSYLYIGNDLIDFSEYLKVSDAASNYVAIDVFEAMFNAFNSSDTKINVADIQALSGSARTAALATINNIKALKAFWSMQSLAAFGASSGSGGGGGVTLYEPLLSINNINNAPTVACVLAYNGSSWGYKPLNEFTTTVDWSDIQNRPSTQSLFGNDYWTSGSPVSVGTSTTPAALSYVTNIDSLLYFDTTNSRVGINTGSSSISMEGTLSVVKSGSDFAIDAIGQLRLKYSATSSVYQYVSIGCLSSTTTETSTPFIRFRDPLNNLSDVASLQVVSTSGTITGYNLVLSDNTRQTRILGTSVRLYATNSGGGYSPCLHTWSGGRVYIQGNLNNKDEVDTANCDLGVDNSLFVKKIYLYKPNSNNDTNAIYLTIDNGLVKLNGSFFATGGVSALGMNTSSSVLVLSDIVNSLNQSSLAAPTSNVANSALVWTGAEWAYSVNTTIRTNQLTSTGSIVSSNDLQVTNGKAIIGGSSVDSNYRLKVVANSVTVSSVTTLYGILTTGLIEATGYKVTGSDDTYVLLAGGGTVALSSIGGGSVDSISLTSGGTSLTPTNGVITFPAATASDYGIIKVSNVLTSSPNIISETGSVARYYAVQLRADGKAFVHVPWENTDNDTKNTTGTGVTQSSSNFYLVGASTASADGVQTYTQANCYMKSGLLYSGGNKVATETWVGNQGYLTTSPNSLAVTTNISVGGNITPTTTNSSYLGSSSLKFKTLYVFDVSASGNIAAAGTLSVTGKSTLTGNVGIGGDPDDSTYKLKVNGHAYLGVDTYQVCIGSDNIQSGYKLYVNGTTKFDGNVGINIAPDSGTTYKLKIDGNSFVKGKIYFYVDSSTTINMEKYTLPSGNYLNVNATGICVNGSVISSDMRKKNIAGDINDLNINSIASAPVFNFTWKDKDYGDGVHVGTSAQYWQNVLPNTVLDMGERGLTLDYNAISIVSAVITARKVVDHEKRIKELESENEILRKELEQLKSA